MTGKELFIKYTSKRDYTGSKADEYAQLLQTIFSHINEGIYPLIEKAEKKSKKLQVLDLTEYGLILRDEIQIADIVFV